MPTNLYGPGDNYHSLNSHVIPGMIRRLHEAKMNGHKEVKCWGSGRPMREFLYSEDLGLAILKLVGLILDVSHNEFNSELNLKSCINVGSSSEVSINLAR